MGSVARVYRGYQAGIDRDVAVKVLRPDLTRDSAAIARFEREARVAGRLEHPNVVRVYSVGALPSGEPFIVMEFLDGLSLRSLLAATSAALDVEQTLHIIIQIADALGAAHGSDVVHRDVKPENVMLVRRGADPNFVKVLDFGLARATWLSDEPLTRDGSVLGTADYLAPETGRGKPSTPRADVYSLATIAYECLSGRRPYVGTGPVDVLVKKATTPPPPLEAAMAGKIPPRLAEWVMRNLARDPLARDPDARAAGQTLAAAARTDGLGEDALGLGATLFGPRTTKTTQIFGAASKVPSARSSAGGASGSGALGLALFLLTLARPAAAVDETMSYEPELEIPTETYGVAELGVGLLSLPTAEVCVERTFAGCSRGDRSLVVSGWPLLRHGHFAFGAGATLALTPTTDPPRNDPPDLPRDHTRTYLTVELTARYYFSFTPYLDGFIGVASGMVVLNDTFRTERGLTEQALVGPRGSTLITEGATLGLTSGVAWMLTSSWIVGGGLRASNWFLPSRPAINAFGDQASLEGNVITLEIGASLSYRSRFVF
jgi:tRNA A-37 threonylcarbamoyl transferase component Bud32